jgi:hypothetical protein
LQYEGSILGYAEVGFISAFAKQYKRTRSQICLIGLSMDYS